MPVLRLIISNFLKLVYGKLRGFLKDVLHLYLCLIHQIILFLPDSKMLIFILLILFKVNYGHVLFSFSIHVIGSLWYFYLEYSAVITE